MVPIWLCLEEGEGDGEMEGGGEGEMEDGGEGEVYGVFCIRKASFDDAASQLQPR